jgi:phosphoglycerol transferase MdoB-like AlkP superfamily enzyme
MFKRALWYPRIGFDKMEFAEQLMPMVSRRCGMAFRGACDADLPPLIVKTADARRPNFIYWLTLNTHIPVAPGEARTRFNCERDDYGGFALARVCRMAELWHDVFAAVAELALDPAIGPAEILVVGDHAPPLWSKKGRQKFEAGKVPWYRLTPRDGAATTTAHNATNNSSTP